MRRWLVDLHLDLCLQQVVGKQEIYICPVCKKVFRVHDGYNLVCSAVVNFLYGRLLLLAKCLCGLLSVHKGPAVLFCYVRWMVLCH